MLFKTVSRFDKEVKALAKKYPHIKNDILEFINCFEERHRLAIFIKSGVYKTRLKNSDKNKGKSGGYRTYYYMVEHETVYFLTIYDKSEKESINEIIIDEIISVEIQ